MINHYNATIRKEARKRWSLNAVRAKARIKAERMAAPILDEPPGKVFVPKRTRPDLKVILERKDGMKVQYSLRLFYGKLIGQHLQMSPKQFGRKLGAIFQLWATP
jgi:hypothetical protein